jgi:hypothetical protein
MDDALPKKAGGGKDEKKFFRTLKKRSPKKFFPDIKQLLKG